MSRTMDLQPDCPGLCRECDGRGFVVRTERTLYGGTSGGFRVWSDRCPACDGERVPKPAGVPADDVSEVL